MQIFLNCLKAGVFLIIVLPLFYTASVVAGDLNITGHRGAAGIMPENTLIGFEKALEIGVDTIELDIHLTLDNKAVVYHDSRLNPAITRNSDGNWIKEKKLLKELTLSEIQSYDVGKLNRKSKYAKKYKEQKTVEGERIPTLRDVIRLVKKTNDTTRLFIEIKFSPLKPKETKSPEEISNVVAGIIKDEKMAERATVISFDWKTLMYFRKIMPDVSTGFVTISKKDFDTVQKRKKGVSPWMGGIDIDEFGSIPEAIKYAGGTYWIVHHRHTTGHRKSISSKIVEKAHAIGVKVFLWTPDSKSRMKELIKAGIDGIVTNRPDILSSIVKK